MWWDWEGEGEGHDWGIILLNIGINFKLTLLGRIGYTWFAA